MGFERVEQLIASARAPLAKRFGLGLHRRLDQALGQIPEPIQPFFPPQMPRVRRGLLEPIVTAEAFGTVIADLVADLVAVLARSDRAPASSTSISSASTATSRRWVETAAPTRDPRHLAKLLGQRIEAIDPGFDTGR